LAFGASHVVPITWLDANASPSIRYRLARDVFPGRLDPAQVEVLRLLVEDQPVVRQLAKKQKDSGVWGGNLLGISPNKTLGIKDVGTIPQYRRLVELGVGTEHRAVRMANRVLFRLVARDEDPRLLFEYGKFGESEPGTESWIRRMLRDAAAAALAHAGFGEDPRVRGAAHRTLNLVSQFVRSEMAAAPFVKSGRAWVLHPEAAPPTIFSMSLLASLPAVQRERAGLVERLAVYLGAVPTKKLFTVAAGKKSLKPTFLLFGDPLHVTAAGQTDDLPFALWWMEVLARLGVLHTSASAERLWSRLLKDLDKDGVWRPKNLRSAPKSSSPWAYHMFPLDVDAKRPESRFVDVNFRMALIARLAGWEVLAV
jgi:hypothetical protein